MTRAIWNGAVIAESDDVVVVDGYHYFPRTSVDAALLRESDHSSVCGWKGEANYYSVVVDGKVNRDAAWYYPDPSRAAATVRDRVGFWRGVKIERPGGRRRGFVDRLRRHTSESPEATELEATKLGRTAAPTAGPAVADIDDESFETATEGGWTLVDFFAPWCSPCKAFHPVFDEVAASHDGRVRFARCNVDVSPRTASALGILSIPTLVLFDADGNEARRAVGVPTRRDLDRLIATAETSAARSATRS